MTFYKRYYNQQILKLASEYPDVKSIEIDYQTLQDYDIALADALIDYPATALQDAHDCG